MTRILAIDTSHEICTVALSVGQRMEFLVSDSPRQHARQLLPMISELLAMQNLSTSDLDAIALIIGPGSFTGLRIGAGVAQGLSYGTGVPVFCVSSLAVMAMKAHLEHACDIVNVCLQARDDEVYAACYQILEDTPVLLGAEQVCSPADAAFTVPGFAAGDGWKLLREDERSQQVMLDCQSDAMVLSRVASALLRNGQGVAATAVLPVYLKEQMDYKN